MSDEYDYNSDSDDGLDEPKPKPNWRRKLEEDAAAGRQAQAEAEAARRELAFYKAQIPMDAPGVSYFVKGYDGDLTADAIRKAATDEGFLQGSTADPTVQAEIAQHSAFSSAANTATAGDQRSVQAAALEAAKKAADSAPSHLQAQVYADTLQAHGFGRQVLPPA